MCMGVYVYGSMCMGNVCMGVCVWECVYGSMCIWEYSMYDLILSFEIACYQVRLDWLPLPCIACVSG